MLGGKHQRFELLRLAQPVVGAHHCAGRAAVDGHLPIGEEPPEDRPVALVERLGQRRVVRQLAQRGDDLEQGLGVVLVGGPGGGHQLVDLLLAHLREPAAPAEARVVHQDVDAVVLLEAGRHEGARLRRPAHVSLADDHLGRTRLPAAVGHRLEPIQAPGA